MFSFISISDYHQQLIQNKISCEDAVHFYLTQIKEKKILNAFVEVFDEEALLKAKSLDQKRKNGEPLGKLHGVIIALKDVICYKDHKVTAASKILQGFTSLYSATAVQRLLNEDAIIIGNCNCDEFAMGSSNENSFYGNVLNAANQTKVPGGSSGGSAVAVQANMCMVSLGSDTGGSVRQPADFCGIVGLKPSYGKISRYGLLAYASSFDQIGVFANTVNDAALLLTIMQGEDGFDSTAEKLPIGNEQWALENLLKNDVPKKYKIAYFKEALHHPSLDKEIQQQIFLLIDKLKSDGHTVTEIDFDLLDYVVPTYYILTTAEASSNLSRYDGVRYGYRSNNAEIKDLTNFYKYTRSEGFSKEVQKRIMLGTFVLSTGYFDAYFTKAQQVRQLLCTKTADIFADYDAVILPTSPTTAFGIGEKSKDPISMYLADIYTVFANLTGIPGISIPLFKHSNALPFGLQILTAKNNELTLLQLSNVLMQQYKTI